MSCAIQHFLDVYGEGAFDVTIEIYALFYRRSERHVSSLVPRLPYMKIEGAWRFSHVSFVI